MGWDAIVIGLCEEKEKRMAKGSKHSGIIVGMALFCILCGCRSAQDHKALADSRALGIIADAQREALGTNTAFTIERPSDSLRRQLLRDQEELRELREQRS